MIITLLNEVVDKVDKRRKETWKIKTYKLEEADYQKRL